MATATAIKTCLEKTPLTARPKTAVTSALNAKVDLVKKNLEPLAPAGAIQMIAATMVMSAKFATLTQSLVHTGNALTEKIVLNVQPFLVHAVQARLSPRLRVLR